MVLWLAMAGCGSSDLRSEPTAPTVTFEEATPEQEIVWTDLEEVFPKRAASLPTSLAELRPGLDAERARAILEAAKQPGVRLFTERVGGTLAVASTLADTTNVGVTLLLTEGTTLDAVDLSLPDEVAVPMLTTRWGPPTATDFRDGGKAVYRWVAAGEPWAASLHAGIDGKAVLKFERP